MYLHPFFNISSSGQDETLGSYEHKLKIYQYTNKPISQDGNRAKSLNIIPQRTDSVQHNYSATNQEQLQVFRES
jgi:hypothetical protein